MDGGDTQLQSAWINGPLAAGGNATANASFQLPRVTPGTYWLICRVDSGDSVFESNEENNIVAVQVTVTAPDLVPGLLSVVGPLVSGRQAEVSYGYSNAGDGEASSSWNQWMDTRNYSGI